MAVPRRAAAGGEARPGRAEYPGYRTVPKEITMSTPTRQVGLNRDALLSAVQARAEERGLSLRAVAGEIGVSPNVFSKLRAGGSLSADALIAVLDWLSVPVSKYTAPRGTPGGGAHDDDRGGPDDR
jgi:hypothetical protein